MTGDFDHRAFRVRQWDKGHPFEEIDALGLKDIGDIISYESVVAKLKERAAKGKPGKSPRQRRS